jgi:hypothetical protein
MARPLAPLLLADADQAARAQIDMMNATIETWRAKLPAKAWASVLVMIQDAHQPRSENLKTTYFDQLLGRTPVPQVVYAESIFDEKGALKLAGSILIDRAISIDTFGKSCGWSAICWAMRRALTSKNCSGSSADRSRSTTWAVGVCRRSPRLCCHLELTPASWNNAGPV